MMLCRAVQCKAGGCCWGPFGNIKAKPVEAMMSAVTPGSSDCVHGNEHCY